MDKYTRYGIYYLPPLGSDLAMFGAQWLGWDVDRGEAVKSLAPAITETPRKYGFHGTLKPPFKLSAGTDFTALEACAVKCAAAQPVVRCDGLRLARLGRFFALVPDGETPGLNALAAACVRDLDAFRAPPSDEELNKRRAKGLSAEQDALLLKWGYPYVMDAFRFHLTLTGPVPQSDVVDIQAVIEDHLPSLPKPFEITEVALVGERRDGAFETIRRLPLTADVSSA